jgi:hypothetical protein
MPQDANELHMQMFYEGLSKEATTPPGTEAVTEGENPYGEPEGEPRGEGSIDAPWGEKNTKNPKEPGQTVPLSKEVLQAVRHDREELLAKLLTDKSKSDKAEQALIRQHFSGSYETNSPQLSEASNASSLMDRIRQVAGRH